MSAYGARTLIKDHSKNLYENYKKLVFLALNTKMNPILQDKSI